MNERTSSRVFARLAMATTAATYLLILVGALVRAAGAGLGCPDWPRCFGEWIPPINAAQLPPGYDPALFNAVLTWTEYLNRLLGVVVGLLIVLTTVVAVRSCRSRPRILYPTVAALLLVGFQGWLGGQVVRSGLEHWMVSVHMLVALVIVTLLLYASYQAWQDRPGSRQPASDPRRRRLRNLTTGAIVLLLIQVGLGTQVRAGIGEALERAPDLARSAWLAQVGDLDHAHRLLSQAVVLAVVLLAFWVHRRLPGDPALRATSRVAVALVLAQLAVGAVLVWMSIPPVAQVLHLSLASLLLGALVVQTLLAGSEPA